MGDRVNTARLDELDRFVDGHDKTMVGWVRRVVEDRHSTTRCADPDSAYEPGTPASVDSSAQDPDAAAFVRSVANGNETVPTVAVGDVHMVNPSVRRVRAVSTLASGVPGPTRRRCLRRGRRVGDRA